MLVSKQFSSPQLVENEVAYQKNKRGINDKFRYTPMAATSDPILDALLAPAHKAAAILSERVCTAVLQTPPDQTLRLLEEAREQIKDYQATVERQNVTIQTLRGSLETTKKDVRLKIENLKQQLLQSKEDNAALQLLYEAKVKLIDRLRKKVLDQLDKNDDLQTAFDEVEEELYREKRLNLGLKLKLIVQKKKTIALSQESSDILEYSFTKMQSQHKEWEQYVAVIKKE